CNVRRTVISQPFNGLLWQCITKASFNRLHHQVAHQIAGDAASARDPAHRFPVATVERECDPHPLTIVTRDLEAVRAPTAIAFAYRDAAIVTTRVERPARVPVQQQTEIPHHPIDPLMVDACSSFGIAPAIHHGPRASIAIRRKRSHLARDVSHELIIISRSGVTALIAPCVRSTGPYTDIGARYTQDVADGVHRSSP